MYHAAWNCCQLLNPNPPIRNPNPPILNPNPPNPEPQPLGQMTMVQAADDVIILTQKLQDVEETLTFLSLTNTFCSYLFSYLFLSDYPIRS